MFTPHEQPALHAGEGGHGDRLQHDGDRDPDPVQVTQQRSRCGQRGPWSHQRPLEPPRSRGHGAGHAFAAPVPRRRHGSRVCGGWYESGHCHTPVWSTACVAPRGRPGNPAGVAAKSPITALSWPFGGVDARARVPLVGPVAGGCDTPRQPFGIKRSCWLIRWWRAPPSPAASLTGPAGCRWHERHLPARQSFLIWETFQRGPLTGHPDHGNPGIRKDQSHTLRH